MNNSTPWILRPVPSVHPCKLCTVLLDPGKPRLCSGCQKRPAPGALLSLPQNNRRFWTRGEEITLRQMFGDGKSNAEIAGAVGRSLSSVFERCAKLKLYRTARHCKFMWTPEQEQLLRDRYNGQPKRIDELVKATGYPRWNIVRRAHMMGLARTKEPHWSRRQEKFLAQWLPHRSIEWIARKLKRTRCAVFLKAKRLKITKSGAGYTANGVAIGLGVDGHKVTRWIQSGKLRASRRETGRHGGQNGDYYFIDPLDLRDFIRANPDEVYVRHVDKRFFIRVLTTDSACAICAKRKGTPNPFAWLQRPRISHSGPSPTPSLDSQN